ncbi:SET domain-containing protein [Patescibacteria group bacterium]|nr:SET domain-containing protein [Patescibacteria group bacterium]MBU1663167.1 SET domain-containing protein [Patescibacteria group bacterium]MBU1934263.1 SET domain-containing protein [Patescibacteria group bacterium]MBU2007694.1 SET domain-containing protein [Patescibacteria group bacterium]MBU2233844.1 SET domain-containing protein [Patescibacteria group bacterium]
MKNRMYSWINPDLKVKDTNCSGKGVYSLKTIKKGALLAIFGGYVMTLKEETKLPAVIGDLAHQIHENFVIGIKDSKRIQSVDMFNHSCEPNAGFNGQIFLVAMNNIKKDEQITFDYAMVLHKSAGIKTYKMKCLCGLKNCRKIITEDDWKNPILQKKYKGYFQYYLEQKIK